MNSLPSIAALDAAIVAGGIAALSRRRRRMSTPPDRRPAVGSVHLTKRSHQNHARETMAGQRLCSRRCNAHGTGRKETHQRGTIMNNLLGFLDRRPALYVLAMNAAMSICVGAFGAWLLMKVF